MKRMVRAALLVPVVILAIAASAPAQSGRFDLGLRGSVVTAGGEPANDIISAGAVARYRFGEAWLVGFSVEKAEHDFETPWRTLGLQQDPGVPVIDTTTESTILTAWLEREFGRRDRRLHWFLAAGLGFASPDVADVQGPLAGGGSFDITTDPGSEVIASAAGGLRALFGRHVFAELGARADYHFADWKVRDRVSGRTGTLDDYVGVGGYLGLGYRF